ncbi:Uncharacterized membrane-anchored protein [Tistlia consotensis]|uniref:Uncharacterized membrane-anchored protein n=1 Tax=Tistlia consotensis USBA 355 TaxID=560819 RepID=A0A1Y6CTX4_9PROT|nr:hypothetical protein [Tistlia consotensis]SMF77707.1 Uncharacterized membrane-anchored protein [Tistlia consotensis USBA 355]SNS20770.1 Uncharacterized membrane-anchored protein [Tistlia consotensis]
MSTIASAKAGGAGLAVVRNRVPKVTVDFWLVKLLAVTVGETAADFLADKLGLGLSNTSWILCGVLGAALLLQFRQKRYVPWIYWVTVVLVSVVGTLVSDNLVDNLGIGLETTTVAFGLALAVTFSAWYAAERTLSIHTIYTNSREAFYWLAILFTFALGTSAGDLLSESLGLGYLQAGLIYGAVIAVVAFAYYALGMNGILAFWLAYILTRPMGASFGDLLSQPTADGGLGLGTVLTSLVFLAGIAAIIVYMTLSHDGDETAAGPGRRG